MRLVQFVSLYRGGEKAQMSTRSGEFVTLRDLRKEVGNDAARLFYVMRSNDQHLDFDMELAKARSNDNPVYYIQYAHARVSSVLRQLHERGLTEAYLYGADAASQPGTEGLNAFFLLVDKPEVYNLPPNPVVPTKKGKDAWFSMAAAAAGMALVALGSAFLGTTKDRRAQ